MIAAAALLAGCAKEIEGGEEGYSLRFGAATLDVMPSEEPATRSQAAPESLELRSDDGSVISLSLESVAGTNTACTKGTPIEETVSSFYAKGFTGSRQWFPASGDAEQVTVGNTYSDYKWRPGVEHTFYGYANMPSGSDVAVASVTGIGVSLDYKAVPKSASAQNDILLGRYSGDGKGESSQYCGATLMFSHPLAAVSFTNGFQSGSGVTAITGVTLSGVYASGKTSLDMDTPTEGWRTEYTWDVSSSTKQDVTSSGISDSFMLIPQNLTTSHVVMFVTVTRGVEPYTYMGLLETGEWKSGNSYAYSIHD